MGKFLGAR